MKCLNWYRMISGKSVEVSDLFQRGQVVYRGENERNEFEIWVDGYILEKIKAEGYTAGEINRWDNDHIIKV